MLRGSVHLSSVTGCRLMFDLSTAGGTGIMSGNRCIASCFSVCSTKKAIVRACVCSEKDACIDANNCLAVNGSKSSVSSCMAKLSEWSIVLSGGYSRLSSWEGRIFGFTSCARRRGRSKSTV